MDYSRDMTIGNGAQGPFDHFLALKINQSSYRQNRFNPNDLLLYAVTDSAMNRKWDRSIAEAVKAAVEGGATIVQIRFVSSNNVLLFLYYPIHVIEYLRFLPSVFHSGYNSLWFQISHLLYVQSNTGLQSICYIPLDIYIMTV